MRFLYDTALLLYAAGIRLAASWNPKARLWIQGRRDWKAALKQRIDGQPHPRIWMHCASLGEFEQGRPVLEALRKHHPDAFVLLTFFSPSGYEIRKNYPGANLVSYLPMDGPLNASSFVDIAAPDLALFVKYEFWYHYLQALKKRRIPTILFSAIFRPGQPFFKPWGGFWRDMLSCYAMIFVQDGSSAELLRKAGCGDKVAVSGDTRFDRVLAVQAQWEAPPHLAEFCGHAKVIVAGSTWPEDEEIMAHYARSHPDIRFVIAPHEIDEDHLSGIEKRFPRVIRYSRCSSGQVNGQEPQVLLMDNMGMLSRLYHFADVTYIGGGFGGAGIHNILEAAVYGKPVVFGPVHTKSREARELVEKSGAFSIQSALEFEGLMDDLWNDPEGLAEAGRIAGHYVQEQSGATAKILGYIYENRLLTS
jgi:3-deoxy-D-manno-octulosonic-acid transferase